MVYDTLCFIDNVYPISAGFRALPHGARRSLPTMRHRQLNVTSRMTFPCHREAMSCVSILQTQIREPKKRVRRTRRIFITSRSRSMGGCCCGTSIRLPTECRVPRISAHSGTSTPARMAWCIWSFSLAPSVRSSAGSSLISKSRGKIETDRDPGRAVRWACDRQQPLERR